MNENEYEREEESRPITSWLSSVRMWISIAVALGGILVGTVTKLSGMEQQIALLNQRLEIITGNHEERLKALELAQKGDRSDIDTLNAVHNLTSRK